MAYTGDGRAQREADCTRQLQQQSGERQDHESLLVKAMEVQQILEVPSLQHSLSSPSDVERLNPVIGGLNGSTATATAIATAVKPGDLMPQHSDFTVPTSNCSLESGALSASPPQSVPVNSLAGQHQQRRVVLGTRVQQRYKAPYMHQEKKQNVTMQNTKNTLDIHETTAKSEATERVLWPVPNLSKGQRGNPNEEKKQQSTDPMHGSVECTKKHNAIITSKNKNNDDESNMKNSGSSKNTNFKENNINCNDSNNDHINKKRKRKISDNDDLNSPQVSPLDGFRPLVETTTSNVPVLSPLTPYRENSYNNNHAWSSSSSNTPPHMNTLSHRSVSNSSRPKKVHETVHAQSLLLALAFLAIWSPSNIMAPNLTQIAAFFHMSDSERDLYLGSYCALAAGVFGFPISAAIGVATDIYSRKILFVGTAIGGALSSCLTGLASNYAWLFCARLLNGGFMSASVPIAFSLLGDLFATEERNAASSGLTAMMGAGIALGQVYSGMVGETLGWSHAFYVSCGLTLFLALLVSLLIREPVRGGKEKVLQDMLKQGAKYEKRLTWDGFIHAMKHNASNQIIMLQGFFSSLPWGIIFVFLNDYLSQERGFSVADATYIVLLFGVGCAIGGILGGYYGALFQTMNRSYLPLFMAASTFVGIFPFLGLLNGHTTNAHGYFAIFYSVLAGIIASLPSVNVRPCLINVNPPETRGASLTAANLIINLARGIGPSCVTSMTAIWHVDRKFSFNVALIVFWTLSAIQLLFLSKTLPKDQDVMEAELADYAQQRITNAQREKKAANEKRTVFQSQGRPFNHHLSEFDDSSLVSIEERMTSFDGVAARESITFVRKGIKEMQFGPINCIESASESENEFGENDSVDLIRKNSSGENSQSPQDQIQSNICNESNSKEDNDNIFNYRQPPTESTHLLV